MALMWIQLSVYRVLCINITIIVVYSQKVLFPNESIIITIISSIVIIY